MSFEILARLCSELYLKLAKRATVEYNGMEVVTAIAISHPVTTNQELFNVIHTMENQENRLIRFNETGDLEKYVLDIKKKLHMIDPYLKGLRVIPNIECIFVSGKTNKHPEIEEEIAELENIKK
jgi:hypothetical protein